jgi:3D (Asp-Asp-Asp) domain-containing protein
VLIARSNWRKILATLLVVGGFVWLYEVTILDSRFTLNRQPPLDPSTPQAGARLTFAATAYCKGKTTASGVNVRSGIAAADPELLPVGSVVRVDAPGARHDGIYTIMDTGPKVQGRKLDLYMWSCYEALDFGHAKVDLRVLRLGWSPRASEPTLIERLFRRREAARRTQAVPPVTPEQIPPSALPAPASSPPSIAADGAPNETAAAVESEPSTAAPIEPPIAESETPPAP